MNRRKFLAFLGIAAAAPKVLAKVAEGMKKEEFLRKYPLTPEDCLPHRYFQVGDKLVNSKGQKAWVRAITLTSHPRLCTIYPGLFDDIGNGCGCSIEILDGSKDWVVLGSIYAEGSATPGPEPSFIKYTNNFQIKKP